MLPPGADTVLIRHGELGVKSASVQRRMERTLANNVSRMLDRRHVPGSVERERGRVFIRTEADAIDRALTVATETFGVLSASPAVAVPATEERILEGLTTLAPAVYTDGSFAVRARRAGPPEAHPFTSKELEERGGSAVWKAVESRFEPRVDLDDPDVSFFVECRSDEAYLFFDRSQGPGGFPIGTQGRTVPLVSGGLDSPVAAWEMMCRGCEISPVYFDFEDYGGPDHVARAVDSVRALCTFVPDGEISLHIVPFGDVAAELVESVTGTRMLSLRRAMFAIAEAIAHRETAHSLATGESIGQKSSQTGWNLAVTDSAVSLPVHRPLLDRDKQEIIEQAKDIGTYSTATIPAGCNRIAPTRPETHGTIDQVKRAEPEGLVDGIDDILDRITIETVSAPDGPTPIASTPQE